MPDISIILAPNTKLANPQMYYPLGALYMSAMYKRLGYSVAVVDFRSGNVDIKSISDSKVLAFSATTPEFPFACEIASSFPTKHKIIGGAHASLMPTDCLPHFDTVVVGEGEEVCIKALNSKGILRASRIKNLDRLPFPDWTAIANPFSEELFVGERYGKGNKAATIIASRGCPAKCAFCANIYNTPVVYRSVESILAEVDILVKQHNITEFRFEDDNITILPHLDRLCNGLSKYKVRFKGHTRSDLAFEDRLLMLKYAGMEECGLGVESADDTVLEACHKKETSAQHYKAVSTLHRLGIRSKTYFVAGLPHETESTFHANVEFIHKAKPDKWTLAVFTPYVGCDIYKHPAAYGVRIVNTDYKQWWNFPDYPVHELTTSTQAQIHNRYKRLYQEFLALDKENKLNGRMAS